MLKLMSEFQLDKLRVLPHFLCGLIIATLAIPTTADEAVKIEESESIKVELQNELDEADRIAERLPKSPSAHIERGMALFAMGKVADSIQAFDQALQLDRSMDASLWQRGIALYYVDRFEDAAKQFEIHHRVNPDDVENSAWYFLCLAKSGQLEEARKRLLPSRGDSRPPLMEVLKVYQGALEPQALAETLEKADPLTQFYGYAYLGWYHEAIGDRELAAKYLKQADATNRGGYMLRVVKVDLASRKDAQSK